MALTTEQREDRKLIEDTFRAVSEGWRKALGSGQVPDFDKDQAVIDAMMELAAFHSFGDIQAPKRPSPPSTPTPASTAPPEPSGASGALRQTGPIWYQHQPTSDFYVDTDFVQAAGNLGIGRLDHVGGGDFELDIAGVGQVFFERRSDKVFTTKPGRVLRLVGSVSPGGRDPVGVLMTAMRDRSSKAPPGALKDATPASARPSSWKGEIEFVEGDSRMLELVSGRRMSLAALEQLIRVVATVAPAQADRAGYNKLYYEAFKPDGTKVGRHRIDLQREDADGPWTLDNPRDGAPVPQLTGYKAGVSLSPQDERFIASVRVLSSNIRRERRQHEKGHQRALELAAKLKAHRPALVHRLTRAGFPSWGLYPNRDELTPMRQGTPLGERLGALRHPGVRLTFGSVDHIRHGQFGFVVVLKAEEDRVDIAPVWVDGTGTHLVGVWSWQTGRKLSDTGQIPASGTNQVVLNKLGAWLRTERKEEFAEDPYGRLSIRKKFARTNLGRLYRTLEQMGAIEWLMSHREEHEPFVVENPPWQRLEVRWGLWQTRKKWRWFPTVMHIRDDGAVDMCLVLHTTHDGDVNGHSWTCNGGQFHPPASDKGLLGTWATNLKAQGFIAAATEQPQPDASGMEMLWIEAGDKRGLWVEGDTFPHRSAIKAQEGRWRWRPREGLAGRWLRTSSRAMKMTPERLEGLAQELARRAGVTVTANFIGERPDTPAKARTRRKKKELYDRIDDRLAELTLFEVKVLYRLITGDTAFSGQERGPLERSIATRLRADQRPLPLLALEDWPAETYLRVTTWSGTVASSDSAFICDGTTLVKKATPYPTPKMLMDRVLKGEDGNPRTPLPDEFFARELGKFKDPANLKAPEVMGVCALRSATHQLEGHIPSLVAMSGNTGNAFNARRARHILSLRPDVDAIEALYSTEKSFLVFFSRGEPVALVVGFGGVVEDLEEICTRDVVRLEQAGRTRTSPPQSGHIDNALEVMQAQMAMFNAMIDFEAMIAGAA